MDARGAPQWVGLRHLADEVASAAIDGRAPGGSARAPGPETPEGRAVPAHDGIRAHDREGAAPTRSRARQALPRRADRSRQGGGRGRRRWRTASCWRRARFSVARLVRERRADPAAAMRARSSASTRRSCAPGRRDENPPKPQDHTEIEFWRRTGGPRSYLPRLRRRAAKPCAEELEEGKPHVRIRGSPRAGNCPAPPDNLAGMP